MDTWQTRHFGHWRVWRDKWGPLAPIILVGLLFVAAAGIWAAWWTVKGVPAGSFTCSNGYAYAKDKADTSQVDRWVIESPSGSRPVNCGVLRRADSLRQASRVQHG